MSWELRIAFFGTPDLAVPYLEGLVRAGHQVCAVVTQPDRPAGRGRELRPPPIKAAACGLDLAVLQPASCEDETLVSTLQEHQPQVGVVVAYGNLLPPQLLDCPDLGCVNVHYSLLPALRGAAPVQRALLAGMPETGVTVQWMSPELDAGDIILQESAPIRPDDNQATLFARLTQVGVPLLLTALGLVAEGTAPRIRQGEGQVTWAPELTKAECRIDWSQPAQQVRNLVAACSPHPGAYTFRSGRRLKVLATRVVEQARVGDEGEPGTFVELDDGGCPVAATGAGGVALVTVQPEGRRVMSGADFARGARFSSGERLT